MSPVATGRSSRANSLSASRTGTSGIRTAVEVAVKAGNTKLSRAEQVKHFTILPTFWEPGGQEITSAMKLKRQPIAAKYADVIDSTYATPAKPT